MSIDAIAAHARRDGLAVVGAFHPTPEHAAPEGTGTIVLLGADGPDLWKAFEASPEAQDTQPHSMDRWSRRVIGALATALHARALFPFDGPPWLAFQRWAETGEGARSSPIGMQASRTRGLWVSYRGALAFPDRLSLPALDRTSACDGCSAPCMTACPVDAFGTGRYDVPRCTAHVLGPDGIACRSGCRARAACPFGADLDLPEAQRQFHMAAFLAANAD